MMKVGFIGLGNMGLPMAKNLVNAGYEVYGKNRSKGKEEVFAQSGGKTGLSIAEMAQELDVILTCLPFPEDVEHVYFDDDGLLANVRAGMVLVDHSTVAPELNRTIAQAAKKKGAAFLDAPISGGNFGAEDGTLTIMTGGNKDSFDKVLPLFQVMGKSIHHIGEIGSGSVVKLLNNLMVSFHTQAVSEAVALGTQMGVDPDHLFEILNASYAQSKIYERHYQNFISKDDYTAGFAIKLLHKDMVLAEQMAERASLELPIGTQLTARLKEAMDKGFSEEDMSALYLLMNKTK